MGTFGMLSRLQRGEHMPIFSFLLIFFRSFAYFDWTMSGIITLGNLKLNIDWHYVTICISLVLNNFKYINILALAVLFCDGTSRYGVPESLTTG